MSMLEKKPYPIDKIHVPVKRAKTLNPDKVVALAEDMLEHGQTTPIRLRPDGDRYVLLEGLHRLEALRALGEVAVDAYLVRARLH
jgi:sulfiredoxin